MRQELGWSPVTLERTGVVYPVMVGIGAAYIPEETVLGGPNGMVIVWAVADGRDVPVGEILSRNAEEFRFVMANGNTATVRATVPGDAALSEQFPQHYDLPVEVIGAIMNGVIDSGSSYLSAATDEQGDVHTVLLVTPLGLYARYSKQWIKLNDVSTISHLNVVDIPPEDLNLYDDADINGQMVNISAMAPSEGEAIEYIEPVPAPVVASAPTRSVIIASLDDVPSAIQFAQTPEGWGSRWYVGRRARALGYTEPLPWEDEK